MKCISGWLFDVYPSASGMVIWLIDKAGSSCRVTAEFVPSFFLHLSAAERKRADILAVRAPARVSLTDTVRKEFYSYADWAVTEVHVHDPLRFKETVTYFERFFPYYVFFNSDILPAQLFLYHTQLFALGFGDYQVDDAGVLREWTLHDDRERLEYELPPLSIMMLRSTNGFIPPKYQRSLQLEVEYDGRRCELEGQSPREILESLNWHLHRWDPDILVTEYGDSILLPKITEMARRERIPLLLNRDTAAGYITSRESSFFQYGKIVHKDGAFELAGRWHVDVSNSFTVSESQLDGLFELVRLTQMPPQRQSRASIGTGLSSLQLSWAYRHGILIPSKKREPEDFKSAATLLLADRGGLIFQPPIGYHENIAELDFVSMYPSIMVNQNVSPETVNCRCCDNHAVPELEYSICRHREGIVPATLRAVVKKRGYYKERKRFWKGKDEAKYQSYHRRQNALKWMLVSCFGYLGYKNARFGKIEAHESVNAFSRDALLTAKEVAEEQGYRLLHGIIDCIWITRAGATESDYQQLCSDISVRVGLDISLEGIYRWILFPSSKQDAQLPTANRYIGWYTHNEYKMRGIEARRHDTPVFIKTLQKALIDQMGGATSIAELSELLPELLETARGYVETLRSGRANPMELVLRRHITREADEYTTNTVSAVVAKMVEAMGVHVAPGESIEFIILDQSGKRKPEKAKPLALYAFEDGYDIDTYVLFALKAIETLLLPFGCTLERLRETFGLSEKKQPPTKKPAIVTGDLFQ